MAKELTDLQKKFIEHLLGDAEGDVYEAKKLAGYSETTLISDIIAPIQEEIVEAAKVMLKQNTVKAVFGLLDVLNSPSAMGARNAIGAAKEVLDRAGLVKPENTGQNTIQGVPYELPAKRE